MYQAADSRQRRRQRQNRSSTVSANRRKERTRIFASFACSPANSHCRERKREFLPCRNAENPRDIREAISMLYIYAFPIHISKARDIDGNIVRYRLTVLRLYT